MKTKLTLRIEESLIRQAKQKAKGRGTSVSQMVADYFSLLNEESEGEEKPDAGSGVLPEGYEFSEFTKAAAGAFGTWDRDVSPEEAHRQHLARKHS